MHFESEAHYQENHVENMFKVSQKASRKATKSLRKVQRILSSFLLNTKIENRSKDQVFIYNFCHILIQLCSNSVHFLSNFVSLLVKIPFQLCPNSVQFPKKCTLGHINVHKCCFRVLRSDIKVGTNPSSFISCMMDSEK